MDQLNHGSKHEAFDDTTEVELKPLAPFMSLTCSDPDRTRLTRYMGTSSYVIPDQVADVYNKPLQILKRMFQTFTSNTDSVRLMRNEVPGKHCIKVSVHCFTILFEI